VVMAIPFVNADDSTFVLADKLLVVHYGLGTQYRKPRIMSIRLFGLWSFELRA